MSLLGAIVGIGGSLLSSRSSSRNAAAAADAQVKGNRESIASNEKMFYTSRGDQLREAARARNRFDDASQAAREDLTGAWVYAKDMIPRARDNALADQKPYANAGENALAAYAYNEGFGKRPSNYRGFEETEAYKFRQEEMDRGLDRSLASSGLRLSGAGLRETMRMRDGLAAQGYDQHQNRLAGLISTGQASANNMANIRMGATDALVNARTGLSRDRSNIRMGNALNTANVGMGAVNQIGQMGMTTASNIGNAYQNMGNARASGYANINAAQTGGWNNLLNIAGNYFGGGGFGGGAVAGQGMAGVNSLASGGLGLY